MEFINKIYKMKNQMRILVEMFLILFSDADIKKRILIFWPLVIGYREAIEANYSGKMNTKGTNLERTKVLISLRFEKFNCHQRQIKIKLSTLKQCWWNYSRLRYDMN